MREKQDAIGNSAGVGEQELAAVLLEAAKQFDSERSVSDLVWKDMRERRLLGQRSLNSRVRMSGPLK